MKLINLIEEDFINYYKPGLFLGFPFCSGKCNIDAGGKPVCQNEQLRNLKPENFIDISPEEIIERYKKNSITQAFIFGGMEPFDTFDDLYDLVKKIRENDDPAVRRSMIVIYTGYYPFEIQQKLQKLVKINTDHPIIVKFGRFIPGHLPHYDNILGVNLASDNQYALIYEKLDGYPCWCNWIC